MRALSREIFREAVFFGSTPFVTPRMISGCAVRSAALAAARSPLAIASSTFLSCLRMRLTRARFRAVRRSVCLIRFFAEAIWAMVALS
jgi:hypothetical protein